MKEIKFRVWDNASKEMWKSGETRLLYNDSLKLSYKQNFIITSEGELRVCQFYPDGVTMNYWNGIALQFTGLKDKNGKEIYHKDMVRYYEELWTVEWNENSSSFEVLSLDKNEVMAMGDSRMEIIGNIYENPELLNRHC